jgi:hypothetical protein
MKKMTLLLGGALAVAVFSAPVMAADFHAMAALQAAPAPMQDMELAATEGGLVCRAAIGSIAAGSPVGGGVCLVGDIMKIGLVDSGIGASFAVYNKLPVTGANFLQVSGG